MCTDNRTFWLGCQHRSEATRYRCALEPFCYTINSANWKSYPCPKCGGPIEEEPFQEEVKTEEEIELESITAELERIREDVFWEREERRERRRLRREMSANREEIEREDGERVGEGGEDEEWEREEFERRRQEMLREREEERLGGRTNSDVILRQWNGEEEEEGAWDSEELQRMREEMLDERGEKSMSGRILRTPDLEDDAGEWERHEGLEAVNEEDGNTGDQGVSHLGLEQRMERIKVEDADNDYIDWVGGRRKPRAADDKDEDWNWAVNSRRRL